MVENIQYKIYKTSIHILFFSYIGNSKIYTIKPGKSSILPGLKYSLLTLFLGWWNLSIFHAFKTIKASLTALHINFAGGEDYTKIVSESDFEHKTIWIYNNLSREISSKITIETLDILVELIDHSNSSSLTDNIIYLNQNLKKINIIHLYNNDLEQILNTYMRYDTRTK